MTTLARKAIDVLKRVPRARASLKGAPYSHFDLLEVDHKYGKMHRLHAAAHSGLINEIAGEHFGSVLEVACGAGWNVPAFRTAGLAYTGMDISETAIAAAALKYPENRYLNIGLSDCAMIKSGSFDVVYNSSMLEHIGYFQEAVAEMLRLARRELWILFFEGLSDEPRNRIAFHPYSEEQIEGREKDIYGRKVILQDHIHEKRKGWYWNRYARAEMLDIFRGSRDKIEILDRTNRPFLNDESVLVVRKDPA